MDAKKYLIETLDYYKQRILSDACTMEEINSVTKALQENMQIHGTIRDFAQFYGVSESNVRATIARKLIAKPERKVLYPFHKFAKIIPQNWRKK